MKVLVIKDCWYDMEYIKAGRTIDFKGDKLPSWATLADGVQTKKDKKVKPAEQIKTTDVTDTTDITDVTGETGVTNETDATDVVPEEVKAEMTDIEKEEYLELLINEGIDKNIFIEDSDKKTVDEQINELEKLLKGN